MNLIHLLFYLKKYGMCIAVYRKITLPNGILTANIKNIKEF